MELLNKADQIDSRAIWTLIAKGNLLLASSPPKLDEAFRHFKYAIESDKNNVVALLGMVSSAVSIFRSYSTTVTNQEFAPGNHLCEKV